MFFNSHMWKKQNEFQRDLLSSLLKKQVEPNLASEAIFNDNQDYNALLCSGKSNAHRSAEAPTNISHESIAIEETAGRSVRRGTQDVLRSTDANLVS